MELPNDGIPERIAADVLRKVDWDGAIPIDPARIAACYGIKIIPDCSLAEGTNSGQRVITDDGNMAILVNPADSEFRRNFTIAHELGHIFLHGIPLNPHQSMPIARYLLCEDQARRFAMALLIPDWRLREECCNGYALEQLALQFGIPQNIVRTRLEQMGLVG